MYSSVYWQNYVVNLYIDDATIAFFKHLGSRPIQ